MLNFKTKHCLLFQTPLANAFLFRQRRWLWRKRRCTNIRTCSRYILKIMYSVSMHRRIFATLLYIMSSFSAIYINVWHLAVSQAYGLHGTSNEFQSAIRQQQHAKSQVLSQHRLFYSKYVDVRIRSVFKVAFVEEDIKNELRMSCVPPKLIGLFFHWTALLQK